MRTHASRRRRALLLAIAALLLAPPAARADSGLALDTSNVPQHAWWYGNYGSAYPGCVNQGFEPQQFAPDATPPDPGPCGNYTQTNTTLELHFQPASQDASAVVSLDVENPSRTGWGYVTVNGVGQGNMAFADHATESWISFPAVTVHAGDDVGVVVKTNYSGQTGRFTLHTAHATLSDLPVSYGAPGSWWDSPLPSNVLLDPAYNPGVGQELASEAAKTRPYVNWFDWSSDIYRATPDTPRVGVYIGQADGTQSNTTKQLQTVFKPGVAAAMTGIPDPDLYGYTADVDQKRADGDSDYEYAAYCAACASPDGTRHGYTWDLWRLDKCDPATALGAAGIANGYAWCARWGGRDSGTQESPGHPTRDWEGYAYPAGPDPSDPALATKAAKFEDPGWMATASSLPLAAGEITVADMRAGVINHALGLSVIYPVKSKWFPPAQRTDGYVTADGTDLYEGMHLQLDPSFDCPGHVPDPVGALICEAFQTHGAYVWDKAGAVGVRAEKGVHAYMTVAPSSVLNGIDWSRFSAVSTTATDSDPFPTP